MAAPTSQSDRPLADCLLDARARARSGVLVITPAGGKPVQVVFRHGNVRHLAPDLDVLKSSSGDPSSAAAALELGHEIVVDRLAALAEASGDPFTFRTDLEPPAVAVPLEVDPAIGVFKSFDNEATDEQQAAAFGDRWDQLLRPGPSFRDLIPAFEAAFPRGPVPRALVTGQTVSDLVAEADDALTVLRQVYAAVRCGLAELKEQRTPGARMAAHGASPEDVPWSVEDDLVISAPRPTGRERNGRTPTNVEALLTQAREEGDPWIGADVYPDVAARVIPRDARIRSGTDIERRPRTGVSSLIHPDSAQVALNLDLVEGTDEDGEDGKEPPTEPGLVSLEAEPAPSAVYAPEPPPEEPVPAGDPSPAAPPEAREPPVEARPMLTVPSEATAPAPAAPSPAPLAAPDAAPAVLTVPPEAAPAPAAPAVLEAAPAVLTVPPEAAPAPAAPAVLTVPPEPGGSPAPAMSAPERPEPVVLTAPPDTSLAAQPAPSGAAPAAAAEDNEERDEALRAAIEDWLDRVWPHVQEGNYYKLLAVRPEDPRPEIVDKHRALVMKYHPDRFERFDLGPYRERLATVWEHVNKGIATLTNDDRRKEYDIFLDRKAKGLPTDPEVVVRAEQTFRMGEKLLAAGRYDEAKAAYEEAISLNRAEPEFHVAHAWAELQAAKHGVGASVEIRQTARQTFEKAAREQPAMDRVHLYLGYLAKMERDMRSAVKHFREAAEINPYNVDAKREIRLAQMRADKDDRDGGGGAGLFGRFRKK